MLTQVIGGHDDTVLELHGYYGRSRNDGGLGVLVRTVGLHVGSIVGAIDIVPWLLSG